MVLRKLLLGVISFAAVPALCQTVPQGTQGGIPLTVGAGYSNFYSDWSERISGYTIWGDYTLYNAPGALKGIAIEVLGRDLNYDRTGLDPKLRMRTGEGGLLYAWRRYRHVQPYGKLLAGYGSINFTTSDPNYSHDTRTVLAEGAGVNFILHNNFVIRADFENQGWPNLFRHHSLTPRGFTIGVAYDFKRH
jgi:Outer membrane protein beta-barrel domain